MKIELTSRGLLTSFFRHSKKIKTIFVTCVILGVFTILFSVPKYDVSGTLIVKFGDDAKPDIAQSENYRSSSLSQNDRRELIQSNTEILLSHDLLYTIVNEFGVATLYPELANLPQESSPIDIAIKKLIKDDLTAKMGLQSNLIQVDFLARNPEVGEKFLHRLFELFMQKQSDVFSNPQTRFLLDQVASAQEHLRNSQEQLKAFKEKNGVSSIDDELTELLRSKTEAQTIAFEAVDDAQRKLSTLQSREIELLATYRDDSPQIQNVRESIEFAKKVLQDRQQELKQNAKEPTSSNGAVDVTAPTSLALHLGEINKRIAALEAIRTEFNDLSRQVLIDENNYKHYKLASEEARVNQTLNDKQITRIAVVNEPTVEQSPARPRKFLILLSSILAGIILGFGCALVVETLDDRFSTPAQLYAMLHVPVIGIFKY